MSGHICSHFVFDTVLLCASEYDNRPFRKSAILGYIQRRGVKYEGWVPIVNRIFTAMRDGSVPGEDNLTFKPIIVPHAYMVMVMAVSSFRR